MGRNGESPGGNRGFQENRGATNAQTMPQDSPEVKSGQRFVPARDDKNPFARVPIGILSRPGLTDGAKLLYGLLARYAGQDGRCHPSQERLARDLCKSARQVRRLVAELEAAGLIRATLPAHGDRARGQAAEYTFTPYRTPDAHDRYTPDIDVPCTPDTHDREHRTSVATDTGHGCPPKRTLLRDQEENTHTKAVCVPSASLSEEQEEYISLLSKREYTEGRVRNLGAFRAKLREKARLGELDITELKALRSWDKEHEAAKQAARFEAIENAAYGVWYDAPGPDRAKAFVSGAMDAALAQQGPEVREALERMFASEIAEARNPRSEPDATPVRYEPEPAPW